MSEGRSKCSLGELFEIENGFAFKSADFQASGIPVIKIKNIKANHFAEGEHSFVSSLFTKERPTKVAKRGDLLISMSGNRHDGSPETWVGKVAPFNHIQTFLINQRVGALRPKAEGALSTRYFGYLLSSWSFQEHFIAVATSSGGQANLSPKQILAVPVEFPPLPEQRAIAAILGALDNKIELNRRINETLEAMARALFRDWFVDFGPTRAKMAGEAPTLSPDLWSLFPHRLDDTGKPEGWEMGTLNDFAALNPESWTARNAPETVAYVDLANTKWGSIDKVEHYAWAKAPSRARRTLRMGDTIVGTVRPGNGSFCYIGEDGLTGSTGFAVLRPKSARDRAFVWCSATSPENIDRLAHLADGGAYPAVRPDAVAATEIGIPFGNVLEAFRRMVSANVDLMEANKTESRTLAQTRDLLLPRLMSGELRVAEAARAVEAVL